MESVIVSPKYQVVIPRSIREPLGLRPGQTVQVILYDNRIELIPVRSIRELRSFLRGQRGRVIDLDASLALESARLSATLKLPLADSIMLATARAFNATLWTQDADFRHMTDVQFTEKVQLSSPRLRKSPQDQQRRSLARETSIVFEAATSEVSTRSMPE
jgi:AbrB family looped-hinge helix DNA binding protein